MKTLRLAAEMHNLPQLREHVIACAAASDLPGEKLSKVELVMEELLVNIIEYAYPDSAGDIEINCHTDSSQTLHIMLADWGNPFNPIEKEDPDLNQGLMDRKIGGLGIYFAKQMADDLQYERNGDKNILKVSFVAAPCESV